MPGVTALSVVTFAVATASSNNELYIGRLVWNRQRFVKEVPVVAVAEAVRAHHEMMNRENARTPCPS